jgi:Asp/Glu/hydantoin racemase
MMKVKGGRNFYGPVIGVLLLETKFPRIPGDVGNAYTYDFPVVFKVVKGATLSNVVFQTDESLKIAFIEAAKELEREGVKAITTSCGFTVLFQDDMAKAVHVPVFASSLLMVPLVYRLVQGRIGIITANSRNLTQRHLKAAGITEDIPVAIAGLETREEFSRVILYNGEDADPEKIEREVIETAKDLVNKYPDIKAFVFECHNLSPFSHAVVRETGLPVFDFYTFVQFVYNAVVKRRWPYDLGF